MKSSSHNGFVVLTSVIILSAVLLLLAATLSSSGYLQGSGTVALQSKDVSYYTALSCTDRAVYKLKQDLDYTGNEDITLGGGYSCHIDALTQTVTPSGIETTIQTSATAYNSNTVLQTVLNLYLGVKTFREL